MLTFRFRFRVQVEESFNVQATFDLLYKRAAGLSSFDHLTFPGVVPRTFLGPLILHVPAVLLQCLRPVSALSALILIRATLAALSVFALLQIRAALRSRHSASVASMFCLLTGAQFHQLYYAGRTLPNVLALVLANLALAARVRGGRGDLHASYALLAVAVAVFRSELSILLFWMIALDAARGRVRFIVAAAISLGAAIAGALPSIGVDTAFWGVAAGSVLPFRYPELEVFYFNAVQGKSVAWGVSPPHWYLTSALPRALGLAYLLVGPGVVLAHLPIADIVLPYLAFVVTYSALPHKELRFVFYALPAANIAAAHALAALLRIAHSPGNAEAADKGKRAVHIVFRLMALGVVVGVFASSAGLTAVSAAASRDNYPGAHALFKLSNMKTCKSAVRVHIGAHAASNGISQFVEAAARCPGWSYSRAEDLSDDDLRQSFTHLVGRREKVSGFHMVHVQHAFDSVDIQARRLRRKPSVFVLERNRVADPAGY